MGRTKSKQKSLGGTGKKKTGKVMKNIPHGGRKSARLQATAHSSPSTQHPSSSRLGVLGHTGRCLSAETTAISTRTRRGRAAEPEAEGVEARVEAGVESGSETDVRSEKTAEYSRSSEAPDSEAEDEPARTEKQTKEEKVASLLHHIREAGLSPFDVFLCILDEKSPTFQRYRTELYKEDRTTLVQILEALSASPKGSAKLGAWLKGDSGQSFLRSTISAELNDLHDLHVLKGVADISPDFIKNQEPDSFAEVAPFTMRLLRGAAQTKRQEGKNSKKKPDTICDTIIRMLLYSRSNKCLGFQAQFGLYLWTTGASRQAIEAVHILGLSISYQAVLDLIQFLAGHCMALVIIAAALLHAFCYDNINISTSIHIAQKGKAETTGKVTSGTLGIVYPLRNAKQEDLLLEPLLARMRNPEYNGLQWDKDLQLTDVQNSDIHHQLLVHVINVVFKYSDEELKKDEYADARLSHKTIKLVSATKQRTEFLVSRVSTTEEASVQGNAKFHDEAYETFKRTPEQLCKYAIPSINDQLTNSRIRTLQIQRKDDENDWHRRLVFQLSMGLFHAALNLAWGILHVHRGTLKQKGSLTYWFSILEKSRLSGAKPDYHTLFAALTEVLNGLLLAAWKDVCAHDDESLGDKPTLSQKTTAFKKYTKSKPTADDIVSKATRVVNDFMTPLPEPFTLDDDSDESEDDLHANEDRDPLQAKPVVPPPLENTCEKDPARDKVHQNTRLLIRDTLFLLELVAATRDGDIGRIELILPHLAMMYRGAGSNNYCTEVLYLIQNLKYVWTPEFADIMRDIMIVNPSGIPGHNIATDINMEYTVGDIKDLIVAKGCESTWDHIGDISAAIDHFKALKRKMGKFLDLPHQNKGHSDVDTSKLVWRVANTVEKEGFLAFKQDRQGNTSTKSSADIVALGAERLRRGTLDSFNRKFKDFVAGKASYGEDLEDDLPQNNLTYTSNELDDAGNDEN